MEALWSAALPVLRQHMGERNFAAWIEPIRCQGDARDIQLEVPSRFFQSWVTRHFLPTIRDTLTELAGTPCAVRVVVAPDGTPRAVSPAVAALTAPAARDASASAGAGTGAPSASNGNGARPPRQPKIGRLVAHYTFDNFVVGAANEVAFQAAQAVSQAPGTRFNPVFLHGGVGLGKTHLVTAIAHEVLRRRARFQVACLSAESFMNALITSLKQDQMNSFRERFRQVDMLILDDIQFLAGKERTQEEFFHTFNALYGADKQIVLTSDKAPAQIAGLEQRLRSRFEGGLIADVHPPTREMRLAILRAKAASQQVELSDEVADLLVQRSGTSVRELEGTLNRVAAMATVRGTEITLEIATAALGPYARTRTHVSVEAIQAMISSRFGVSVADLISHRREREVSYPRQLAMYLSRTVAEASFPTIAEKFGGRDHSTVMYAVRVIETRRAAEAEVDQTLAGIEGELRQAAPRR
ncbi:MAG: chromosomal replication initiator protein DnaA [Deltaproteobacteria bacterium]|nr:chromosomal replication initiator protein DnaA [Deltaproteobacteria bacterium]